MTPNPVVLAVLKVLGILPGTSLSKAVEGTATHATLLPILAYLAAHAEREVSFRTTFGFIFLVVGVLYFVLELLRRSRP